MRSDIAETGMVSIVQQVGVCGNTGYYRHQVQFIGTVVTDNQQSFVVDWLVELQLRDDKLREPFGHFFGNDVCVHQVMRGARIVRVSQLKDRLIPVELDKVFVFHACPVSLLYFCRIDRGRATHAHGQRIDRVIAAVLGMAGFGVQKPPGIHGSVPRSHEGPGFSKCFAEDARDPA